MPNLYENLTRADLIDRKQVLEKYKISAATLYSRMSKGQIPKSISFPSNSRNQLWIEKEVDDRIKSDLLQAQVIRDDAA